jgi:hypothetical protein
VSSDVGAGAADAGHRPAADVRWQLPFWALQVLELGVAFLLVTQSVHVARGGLLVAGGIVLFVLAVTADGPLGVVRVCGRRLHRVLVMVTAVVLAVGCAIAALRPDVEGLLVIGAAVVALVLLAARTTVTGGRGRRRRGSGGRGEVIDATATVTPSPDQVNPDPEPDPDPDPDPDADSALRRAGRTTGAAAAAGRRAVDDHRPQVEDGVRRTIRGAGRLAGRLAGPKPPPDAADRA